MNEIGGALPEREWLRLKETKTFVIAELGPDFNFALFEKELNEAALSGKVRFQGVGGLRNDGTSKDVPFGYFEPGRGFCLMDGKILACPDSAPIECFFETLEPKYGPEFFGDRWKCERDTEYECVLVERKTFLSWLGAFRSRLSCEASGKGTKGAEKKCKEWLFTEISALERPSRSRKNYEIEAKLLFGVGNKIFKRVWDQVTASYPELKKAGRKPKGGNRHPAIATPK